MLRITDAQWDLIRTHFPEEHIPDDRLGRKPILAQKILDVVRWRPNTGGAQWHMLPQSCSNYKSVHRHFQPWCENEAIRVALTEPRRMVAAMSPGRRGKGLKIMAVVDRHGLPLAVTPHAENHHEVTLVQLTFDFYMIEAEP